MWQDQPLGLYWDTRIYNTFAIPVLGYVAQLEAPPDWVLAGIRHSLTRAAKGPKDWATPEDLWSLKEAYGLHASFRNLEWNAQAAQIRVGLFDPACLPKSQFQQDISKTKQLLNNVEEIQSRT